MEEKNDFRDFMIGDMITRLYMPKQFITDEFLDARDKYFEEKINILKKQYEKYLNPET